MGGGAAAFSGFHGGAIVGEGGFGGEDVEGLDFFFRCSEVFELGDGGEGGLGGEIFVGVDGGDAVLEGL